MLNFRSTTAFNVDLRGRGIGITLFVVFKADDLLIILLAINAGLPLGAPITVVANRIPWWR